MESQMLLDSLKIPHLQKMTFSQTSPSSGNKLHNQLLMQVFVLQSFELVSYLVSAVVLSLV